MARAKKVDPDAALVSAMLGFWQYGFHNLGTRELEVRTGITRFTLQTTYGGKRALFLMALDHYLDVFEAKVLPLMDDGSLTGLASWYGTRPAPEVREMRTADGCLMVNSIIEFAKDDPDINERADRYFSMMADHTLTTLNALQRHNKVRADLSTQHATNIVVSLLIALHVTNTAHCRRKPDPALAAEALIMSWAP